MEYNNFDEDFESEFDIKGFLVKYGRHWKWFVLGAAICLTASFLYLRYTTPQFRAETTILVKDEKRVGCFLNCLHSLIWDWVAE